MANYDSKIHHSKSIRLNGYDYSQEGLYFITLCCKNKICRFGKIENHEMILNEYGKIAYDEWLKTPELRPQIELDVFIVMPNHFHCIIKINSISELSNSSDTDTIQGKLNSPLQELRSPSQTVGSIIRGYKSSVTKQLKLIGFDEKLWQRNYYEHIIRNEKSYHRIANYIINNPAKWEDDRYYM